MEKAVSAASALREAEKKLGWAIKKNQGKIEKQLRGGNSFEIVRFRDGGLGYNLKLPFFSVQEIALLGEVLNFFQEKNFNATHAEVVACLKRTCIERMLELEQEQKEYLLSTLNSVIFGFGPLDLLLEDDKIEEIAVTGVGKSSPVRVFHRSFGWLETNFYIGNESTLRNLVNKMSRGIGRHLSLQNPKLNANLPDGSRIAAAISPVAFSGPVLTVRKFRKNPFTPSELVKNKTISGEAAAFLWMALQTDCSMLIAGNTGSGKTSSLNAFFSFVPRDERIIVVEETPELSFPHKHIVKLNTVENLNIGMQELITDTLRMRPDRIVVGEVRNEEEINAFVDTLLAGQGKGSYATFHAQSAQEALARLKNFVRFEKDLGSIDLLLVQKRWNRIDLKNGARREIRRIVSVEEVVEKDNGLGLNTLFGFNYKKDRLEKKNKSIRVFEKMQKCFSLGESGLQKEIKKRERVLRKISRKELQGAEFLDFVEGFDVGKN